MGIDSEGREHTRITSTLAGLHYITENIYSRRFSAKLKNEKETLEKIYKIVEAISDLVYYVDDGVLKNWDKETGKLIGKCDVEMSKNVEDTKDIRNRVDVLIKSIEENKND